MLGGITVVLYGMIGLLGAKIWKENRVDFANPINLVPLGSGHHHRHRRRRPWCSPTTFSLGGIALGTIVAVAGWHVARALAPAEMKEALAREGLHPASGTTFGHIHGDEDHAPTRRRSTRSAGPGVSGDNHGEGKHNR